MPSPRARVDSGRARPAGGGALAAAESSHGAPAPRLYPAHQPAERAACRSLDPMHPTTTPQSCGPVDLRKAIEAAISSGLRHPTGGRGPAIKRLR
jgi:hypothetical protein